MKKSHRLPALLLLPALCASLLLSGCSKEPPTPPDQVATGFYDLIIRRDAAALKDILEYETEEALWQDFVGGEDQYEESMVGQTRDQFEQMGLTLTDEDTSKLFNGIMTALAKLEFTAEVTEMDEKNKTAVVTAHIGYFDPAALEQMATDAVNSAMEGMDQSELQTQEGINKFLSAYLGAFCDGLAALEPADGQKDITVDFEFIKVEIADGKTKEIWMPTNPEQFGAALSTTALGM